MFRNTYDLFRRRWSYNVPNGRRPEKLPDFERRNDDFSSIITCNIGPTSRERFARE